MTCRLKSNKAMILVCPCRSLRDSNPCLPDDCWELLPTELQGHTLKVVHILKGFCFYSITHIPAELYSFCNKEKVDS